MNVRRDDWHDFVTLEDMVDRYGSIKPQDLVAAIAQRLRVSSGVGNVSNGRVVVWGDKCSQVLHFRASVDSSAWTG